MRILSRAALLLALAVPWPAAAQVAPGPFRIVDIAAPAEAGEIALDPESATAPSRVREQWGRIVGDMGPVHIEQRIVRNVSQPTITPVLPAPDKANGAALIVAPGGAFLSLSIDDEGFKVAHWLADHGIAAFVLKYRLNQTPADNGAFMAKVAEVFGQAGRGDVKPTLSEPRAALDALRAIAMVRGGAAKWHVDPARIGMIGFSAGAMTSLQAVLTGKPAELPNFFGYIYGPMTRVDVPAGAPPMFAAFALDDSLFGHQGFGLVEAWQDARRPVELHAYEKGDHGFGMGRPGTTSTLVMDELVLWLRSGGFLGAAGR